MTRFFWTITAFLFSSLPAAFACPGCKEPSSVAGQAGVTGVSLGFSASVLFMLGVIATVAGSLIYMIVRTCRQLEGKANGLAGTRPQPAS